MGRCTGLISFFSGAAGGARLLGVAPRLVCHLQRRGGTEKAACGADRRFVDEMLRGDGSEKMRVGVFVHTKRPPTYLDLE